MHVSQLILAATVAFSLAGCADNSDPHRHPSHRSATSSVDDRQFNIQSRNFETSDQATGLEVGRRNER
ncbi:MAG TPA: hypothetical protein VK961_02725 [Chthoniobacter sp.]|nr:hypothetical protein [Chthoniobacter sp.]